MSAPEHLHDLQAGDLIADRFRLGSFLGSGGMADVWSATDERLRRTVAVKILRDDPSAPEQAAAARRRFRDEGRLAARQIHRNIVAVFDAGTHAGRAYLVMEHLSGETLRDQLARGPLTDAEARQLMADVLAGLDVSHRAGIVHRDIKPSNVLRDGDGRWKVADFGIAKALDEALASDLTLTGQVVGTPRYMAPERLAGHPATPASDLYSVGAILREALVGRDDADPGLLTAATRATSIDPAERFASARSMADALVDSDGATVEADTIATAGPPTQHLSPTAAGWRPASWGLAAIAVCLLVGALAAATMRGDGRATPAPTPSTATSTTATPTTAATAPTTTVPAEVTTAVPATTAPAAPPPNADPKAKGKGKDGGKAKGKG